VFVKLIIDYCQQKGLREKIHPAMGIDEGVRDALGVRLWSVFVGGSDE
jgi:hypothetical protein